MHASTVIKWLHYFLTVGLLLLVVGFVVLNHETDYRDGDTVQNSHRISDHLWLYVTRSDNGGATVPVVYRYYLADEFHGATGSRADWLKQMIPFLEGNGSISAMTQQADHTVKVIYRGDVLSLDTATTYRVNGTPVTVNLSYQIN